MLPGEIRALQFIGATNKVASGSPWEPDRSGKRKPSGSTKMPDDPLRKPDPASPPKTRSVASRLIGTVPASVHALNVTEILHLRGEVESLRLQLEDSQERERRRIAREMHDSSVQDLVAISLILKRLQGMNLDAEANAVLSDGRSILARTQRDLRTLSYMLHPPALEGGLVEALGAFIRGLSSRMTMRIDLVCDLAGTPCCPKVEYALFRVVQEALINVHKHAEATYCVVRYLQEHDRIVLEIEDDGVGLKRDCGRSFGPGVGLPGMQDRVEQLGGTLVLSNTGTGLKVCVAVPGERAAANYLAA